MDFLTAEPKATSAARKTEPLYASPEASVANNGDLILRPEHLRLLDMFRQTLRSCKTDADRFQACADCRDNILAENAAFQYLVAEIETIILKNAKNTRKGRGKAGLKEQKSREQMQKIGRDLLVLLGKGRTQFTNASLLFAESALSGGRKRYSIMNGHIRVRSTVKY